MEETHVEPRCSYRVGYILCLFFGFLGAHRFYVRRWLTGLLYLATTGALAYVIFFLPASIDVPIWGIIAFVIVFNLLVFAWLLDLVTLPILIRERRDIERGIPIPPATATWAADEKKTWWNRFQILLRIAILMFAPAITIVIAASLGQTVIIALVFVILAFCLLLGSIGRGLYALEDLQSVTQRVPFLPTAIGMVGSFQEHYSRHRSHSVFYYLFYPITGPILILFSPSARSEFRPFLSLFSLVVIGVLIQNIYSFSSIFPISDFYHRPYFGVWICLALAAGGILLFFMCVVPLVSSSFYLSMTGRGFSLRFGSAVALFLSAAAITWSHSASSVSFRGAVTLMEKMNNEGFRNDFAWLNKVFLEHELEARRETKELEERKKSEPDKVWESEEEKMLKASKIYRFQSYIANLKQAIRTELATWWFDTSDSKVRVLPDSTESYAEFMASKLRPEEAAAFRVVEIDSPTPDGEPWLAILYAPEPSVGAFGVMGETVVLYAMAPKMPAGIEIFERWSELPLLPDPEDPERPGNWFDDVFEWTPRTDPHSVFTPDKITEFQMIGDYYDLGNIPVYGPWEEFKDVPGGHTPGQHRAHQPPPPVEDADQ